MKTITVNLFDPASVDNAIAELNAYKKSLKNKCIKLIELMCREGEDYALNTMGHVDTGETLSSIIGYRQGNIGLIQAGGASAWIEFGTGTVSGKYDGTIPPDLVLPKGWVYPGKGHGKDRNGWYYYDERDGKVHHTFGIPATSFMYRTAQMLRDEVEEYARKIFNG